MSVCKALDELLTIQKTKLFNACTSQAMHYVKKVKSGKDRLMSLSKIENLQAMQHDQRCGNANMTNS